MDPLFKTKLSINARLKKNLELKRITNEQKWQKTL